MNDTIPTRSNGLPAIHDVWYNVLRNALMVDLFPRDNTGAAVDQAGSLGTSSLRFLRQYLINLRLMNGNFSVIQKASAAMTADFGVTWLTSLPGSTLPCLIDNTGIVTTGQVPTAAIKDGGIAVRSLDALNYVLSASSGAYASSAANANVTNLTATITTSGRPVRLMLVHDGTANPGYIGVKTTTTSVLSRGNLGWTDGVTILGVFGEILVEADSIGAQTGRETRYPLSVCSGYMFPAAGTYTYNIYANPSNTAITFAVNHAKLLVYEL